MKSHYVKKKRNHNLVCKKREVAHNNLNKSVSYFFQVSPERGHLVIRLNRTGSSDSCSDCDKTANKAVWITKVLRQWGNTEIQYVSEVEDRQIDPVETCRTLDQHLSLFTHTVDQLHGVFTWTLKTCFYGLYLRSPPPWRGRCCWGRGSLHLWPSLSGRSVHWELARSPEAWSRWSLMEGEEGRGKMGVGWEICSITA